MTEPLPKIGIAALFSFNHSHPNDQLLHKSDAYPKTKNTRQNGNNNTINITDMSRGKDEHGYASG